MQLEHSHLNSIYFMLVCEAKINNINNFAFAAADETFLQSEIFALTFVRQSLLFFVFYFIGRLSKRRIMGLSIVHNAGAHIVSQLHKKPSDERQRCRQRQTVDWHVGVVCKLYCQFTFARAHFNVLNVGIKKERKRFYIHKHIWAKAE